MHFTGDMLIQSKKDEFVANKENKAYVRQCQAGSDVLIVQTTVASVQTKHTILVGDDTDLLVLLLHPDIDANNIFVSPENIQTSKTEKVWCTQQCKAW